MKLFWAHGETFEFQIGRREKDLLLDLLKLYPLVPEAYHRLSRGSQIPNQEENQHLLDEALKAQRLANQKIILAMLDEPGRFAVGPSGFRTSFTRVEIEWLLQVLNDIRIGSWIALGSPGYSEEEGYLHDHKSVRHAVAMEIAGGFESHFLGAVSGDMPPEPD